jgi:pyruvate formate lyase activating enzyme
VEAPLRAPVFDVQRFSIHDGPGIRTTVFFKGCNLECAWCQNPESQDVVPVVAFYQNRCKLDFSCAAVCPQNAIRKGCFRIDYERCTRCLRCIEACPNGALKLIGEQMETGQLFSQILADEAYYKDSGGGVTFSGGEPSLYPAFMDAMLDLCQARGIHTTMETCGTFSQKRWADILPKLDLIYFDLKIMDEAAHKAAAGVGNQHILDNARFLVAKGYPVEFRLPLVEGYTDAPDNLAQLAVFLEELGQTKLHLLGYHKMGESKIDIIQGSQIKLGLENYPDEKREEIAQVFEQNHIAILKA